MTEGPEKITVTIENNKMVETSLYTNSFVAGNT